MEEVIVKEKVLVNKEVFRNAVNNISKAVPRKSPVEILKCIYITIDNDSMSLEADDGRNRIKSVIEVESDTKTEMLIEANILSKLVNKLNDDTIEFTIDEEKMVVELKNGKYKRKIKFMDSSDYPSATKKKFDTVIKITDSKEDLIHSLKKSLVSTSTDQTKPILNGVKLVLDVSKDKDYDSSITLYSLDGFRLTKDKISIDIKALKTSIQEDVVNRCVIIPSDLVKIIISTIESIPKDESIVLAIGEDILSINSAKEKILSITMLGSFPDCDTMINMGLTTKEINVNRIDLKDALERATLITENTKNNLVLLDISKEKETIVVTTQNDKSISAEELDINEIEKFNDGDNLKIGFNSRYLLQALSLFDEENITLRFTNKLNPVIMTDNSNVIHLLLPVRTRD